MNVIARIIVLGEQRFDGVWFAPTTSRHAAFRSHDTGRADLVHIATDDLSRAAHIRDRLVDAIRSATHKVLFCSFLFADDAIVRALCEAAERLHGGVYILTALGKHLRPDLDVDAADAAMQRARADRHTEHLRALAHAGAWLRSTEDCHAKFATIDDRLAIVTSANATQEAYEQNPEDGLVARDEPVARDLSRLFAHTWRHLASLESVPGSQLDVRSIALPRVPRWQRLEQREPIGLVATLRKQEASLREAAIGVIDAATERLTIATYSFSGIEAHPIGHALQRALARDVEIELLLRPRNHIAAQRRSCAWLCGLAPERVRIHGHRRTHTKSIVADDRDALLWTGNLEAAHGWEDGIEVGLRVRDAGAAAAIAAWTSDVMNRATHVGLRSPSANELVGRGAASPISGTWDVHVAPGTSVERIATLVQRCPVEVIKHGEGIGLKCADDVVDVRIDENARRFDVVQVGRADRYRKSDSLGWAAACTLRFSVESRGGRA